jgi:hypothetical protein
VRRLWVSCHGAGGASASIMVSIEPAQGETGRTSARVARRWHGARWVPVGSADLQASEGCSAITGTSDCRSRSAACVYRALSPLRATLLAGRHGSLGVRSVDAPPLPIDASMLRSLGTALGLEADQESCRSFLVFRVWGHVRLRNPAVERECLPDSVDRVRATVENVVSDSKVVQ